MPISALHLSATLALVVSLVACSGGSSSGGNTVTPLPEPIIEEPGYSVGGTVSGLQGNMTINDGKNRRISLSTNGPFDFSALDYRSGEEYRVSIEKQSTDQECFVSKGNGTVADSNIRNVEIYCHDKEIGANLCANPLYKAAASYELITMSKEPGMGMGKTGTSIFDSDDDGFPEILLGASQNSGPTTNYFIVEYDPITASYGVLCQSLQYSSGITRIQGFENNSFSAASMVARGNGDLDIVNHRSGELIASIATGIEGINDLLVGDVDNDGATEIAVLATDRTRIYDANTFKLEKQFAYGGQRMEIGHFTHSVEFELAYDTGYIFNIGEQHATIVWDYSAIGFASNFAAADLDSDNLTEIVTTVGRETIQALNADEQNILWEHLADDDIEILRVSDTDNSGTEEVIYSYNDGTSVQALQGSSGANDWNLSGLMRGMSSMLLGDFNKDNNLDIMWGAGHFSTAQDYLLVHDIVQGTTHWQIPADPSPYYAVAFGDLNRDSIPDSVYASIGYDGDGVVTAIDARDGSILWQTERDTLSGIGYVDINAVAIGDADNDGENEVVIATYQSPIGSIVMLNATNGAIKSSIDVEAGSPIHAISLTDIDNDGDIEIVAGNGMRNTASTGVHVYVIDGTSKTIVRKSPKFGDYWDILWTIEVVNIDDSGSDEVLALLGGVYILDLHNNAFKRSIDSNYTALASISNTVYAGDDTGSLFTIDKDAAATSVANLCASSITALEDVSATELAFTCEGRLGIYDLVEGHTEWQMDSTIDPALGQYDTLAHEIVQGRSNLLVGGASAYQFRK